MTPGPAVAILARMDIAVLVILWVQLTLGLVTLPLSLAHSDGSVMLVLAHWAQGILTLQPVDPRTLQGVALPYLVHLVLGMTIFLIFPFTRLAHVLSGFFAPLRYLLLRPGYQNVRSRRRRPLEDRRRAFDARQGKPGPSATTPAE